MTDLDAAALRQIYDEQLRTFVWAGAKVERDGPLLRFTDAGNGGFIGYRDLDGLSGEELDALIARQVRFFDERGERFEWKTHGHDRPDLPARLLAQGFTAEERETVVVGLVGPLAAAPPRHIPGVRLREVTGREDLDRIGLMQEQVWGGGAFDWLVDSLEDELRISPENLIVVVAEADGRVVSAAWVRFMPGTDFAGLYGGATLLEYRGQGIYKALVEHRARRAAERGVRYLQVDASPDSRPILERLGLIQVATTTPYVHRPGIRP